LATTQARFAQPDAKGRHRDMLDDFVLPIATRARHRLRVRLDDGGAHDWQRPLRRAAQLELEQALPGGL
jgi:hypothetical protein